MSHSDSMEDPLQRLERTYEQREVFNRIGWLPMIGLLPDDEISVHIGKSEEDSFLSGRLITNRGGRVLRVTESTSFKGEISLGTYAKSAGNTGLVRLGILRGCIQPDCFAVVDVAGKAFYREDSDNLYLPDTYTRLAVNGVEFFK